MSKNIHGHEVIAMIANADPLIKESELLKTIEREFPDTVFHTCSKENLTPKELIDFLEMANKLYFVNGFAKIRTENVCEN